MLNSGKKICASRDKKKINILILVLSEKKTPYPPPPSSQMVGPLRLHQFSNVID